MRVGVLALQGGFEAHARALTELGHAPVLVRDAQALARLAGLVLPGGESTTQWKLLERHAIASALDAFVRSGKPVLATCAGLVLAARRVEQPEQRSFGWIDVDVARNAWGRQLDSFEATADDGELPVIFIRAPRITRTGDQCRVLASFRGEPILVNQANVTAASFHPELTPDRRIHRTVFGPGAAQA
jgi:5'-phosphate synthase pdxT subunit